MLFKVRNKLDRMYWRKSPCEVTSDIAMAYLFDSSYENDVDNVMSDYSKELHSIIPEPKRGAV